MYQLELRMVCEWNCGCHVVYTFVFTVRASRIYILARACWCWVSHPHFMVLIWYPIWRKKAYSFWWTWINKKGYIFCLKKYSIWWNILMWFFNDISCIRILSIGKMNKQSLLSCTSHRSSSFQRCWKRFFAPFKSIALRLYRLPHEWWVIQRMKLFFRICSLH